MFSIASPYVLGGLTWQRAAEAGEWGWASGDVRCPVLGVSGGAVAASLALASFRLRRAGRLQRVAAYTSALMLSRVASPNVMMTTRLSPIPAWDLAMPIDSIFSLLATRSCSSASAGFSQSSGVHFVERGHRRY